MRKIHRDEGALDIREALEHERINTRGWKSFIFASLCVHTFNNIFAPFFVCLGGKKYFKKKILKIKKKILQLRRKLFLFLLFNVRPRDDFLCQLNRRKNNTLKGSRDKFPR